MLDNDGCDIHLVSSQRAGFICTDNRYGAYRFYCWQTADNGVSPGHGLNADSQSNCQYCREAFRDGGYSQTNDGHEKCVKGLILDEDTEGQYKAGNGATLRKSPSEPQEELSVFLP